MTCQACGLPLPDQARFCPDCGTEQARASGRRMVSVLFADLVGFTPWVEGRDHEDARDLLDRWSQTCRLVVERFGGTVEKFIGDAVVATWGVPVAHEDDGERAVRAGLELVAAVAGLTGDDDAALGLRAGIVTQEATVMTAAPGQGAVVGPIVSAAADLQAGARPGQLWVDATTRALTHRSIRFTAADPDGHWVAEEVVAGVGGSHHADGLGAPMVGRARELRLLKEVFHRTTDQGGPSMVVLCGEAGLGKSRLAWEFEKYVDGLPSGTRWHAGRCVAYGERVPFHALAEAVRARLRVTAGEDTDPADLLAVALPTLVPDEEERAWIGPRLDALLGTGPLGEFSQPDLFAAWTTFVQRVGEGADAVVLVLEDAEHTDEGLLDFVDHLLDARAPVFVLLLTRPALLEAHPGVAQHPRAVLVNLAPLGDADLRLLLDGLVAGLPHGIRDALAARSEGVPLYAVETVRSLVDRDLVVQVDDRYVLADRDTDLSLVGAPVSLQALVTARLDALAPALRRAVDAAAVLGRAFHRDHLAGMLGAGVDLDPVLQGLQRGQFVVRDTNRWSGDFGRYRFAHAIVPQVAYGLLTRRDRRAAHLRADALYGRLDDPAGTWAAVWAEHLIRAAEAVPREPDVPELRARAVGLLERAAQRSLSLGALGDGVAHLEAARAVADDPVVAARLDLRRGRALTVGLAPAAGAAVLAPLVPVFDALGDEVSAGVAAGLLGLALFDLGRVEEVRPLVEPRWEALRDRPGADAALVQLASAMGVTAPQGQLREYAEALVRVGLRTGDDRPVASGFNQLGFHYDSIGLPRIGRLFYAERLGLATDPRARMLGLLGLATSWTPDDLDQALDHARQALAAIEGLVADAVPELLASNMAMVQLAAGEWDDALATTRWRAGVERPVDAVALDLVATAITQARGGVPTEPEWQVGDLPEEGVWHLALGLTEVALRRRTFVAVGDAVAALVRLAMGRQADDLAVVWPWLFAVAREVGHRAAADRLLRLAGEEPFVDRPAFRAHRTWAEGVRAGEDGDAATAAEALRQAVRLYEAWGSPPIAALVRAEFDSVGLSAR